MSRLSGWIAAAALGALLTNCDGDSNVPTTPTGGPAGGTTVSGRVVGTINGGPVAGARVQMGGASATSDGSGHFRLSASGPGDLATEVGAANHVTRKTFVRQGGPDPVLDLIEPSNLWNLEFYRELCRDGSGGGTRKPLNPWTVEPRFYVDRSAESGSNRPIPDSSVDTVLEAIRTVLPLLTRGKLGGSQIEVGTAPPPDRTPGTAVIRWDPVEISEVAGPASGITYGVGGNSSVVVLRTIEDTESIFHELGHVLGLYHPLGGVRPSYMIGSGVLERPHFTQWDILHANILYSRPPGNTDVDNDPAGFAINAPSALSAGFASRVVMICK